MFFGKKDPEHSVAWPGVPRLRKWGRTLIGREESNWSLPCCIALGDRGVVGNIFEGVDK